MYLARLLLLTFITLSTGSHALSTDRDQPINIEADKLDIDESQHISTYQGNVAMQQGTLRINADQIILHFDTKNELQKLEVNGSPARFTQINDQQQTISGSALQIIYHQADSLMNMYGEAQVISDQDQIESETIQVNTATNALQAGDSDGTGRVRMLIRPKPGADQP